MIFTATQPFATLLINSNPEWFRYDLIWRKSNPTGFLNANRMPLRNHEMILVFYKRLPIYNPQFWYSTPYIAGPVSATTNYGKFNLTKTISADGKRFPVSVMDFKSPKRNQNHPTQKPIDMFEYLIKTYSNEGGIVLDNCIGSGTTAIAALNTGRSFIGMEMDVEIYNKSLVRLEEWRNNVNRESTEDI